MTHLLDTHGLIWFLEDSPQLSDHARGLIENETNDIFVSVASLWEIAIKVNIGKLALDRPFADLFPVQLILNNIGLLGVTVDHLHVIADLPMHHRDPFDRMIIAQAKSEDLPVISVDPAFDAYGIGRKW